MRSRCMGVAWLHNRHTDTVLWAVEASIPGRQRVGTDAPSIGYGYIGTEGAF